ncbi:unannotated protein [freshwater metagenome]|uniref:Unannotated protein n=1 Tax=freshwater metagenome TaxID=449393 RepID=A0A6J6A180_9ZZZZ
MLMIMSKVIATLGTLRFESVPSCFSVIPSCAIPNSARAPSIVAVFIERTNPPTRQTTITLAKSLPTSVSNAVT